MTDQKELTSVWQGSTDTMHMVARQIFERWGEDAVREYDPRKNCFTFNGWKQRGYMVQKGEHGLKSIVYIKVKVKKAGKEIEELRPRTVTVFWKEQVKPIEHNATMANIVTGERTEVAVEANLVAEYGLREAEDMAIERHLESVNG